MYCGCFDDVKFGKIINPLSNRTFFSACLRVDKFVKVEKPEFPILEPVNVYNCGGIYLKYA
jgi:hypothetical protein